MPENLACAADPAAFARLDGPAMRENDRWVVFHGASDGEEGTGPVTWGSPSGEAEPDGEDEDEGTLE